MALYLMPMNSCVPHILTLYLQAPASEIQDKISFIINNISTANLDAKSKEFAEIIKEQYYPWFAQYMVMKRLETI